MAKTETPSNTFTLLDLERSTRKRLGPTRLVIGDDVSVDLPSVFRLPEKTRTKVWDALRQVDTIGDDTDDEEEGYALLVEAISETLLLVTPESQKIIDAVAEAAGDDVLMSASLLGDVLGKWMEHTQAGEA
jgi:hypothetical protein